VKSRYNAKEQNIEKTSKQRKCLCVKGHAL